LALSALIDALTIGGSQAARLVDWPLWQSIFVIHLDGHAQSGSSSARARELASTLCVYQPLTQASIGKSPTKLLELYGVGCIADGGDDGSVVLLLRNCEPVNALRQLHVLAHRCVYRPIIQQHIQYILPFEV
jgi:hypothetical protein